MACENRMSPHHLIDELENNARRFDFFEALRLIEALNPDKPRLGQGVKASDDMVRLAQEPELQFSPSTIASYSSTPIRIPRLSVYFFGLFGPNGPLPLHLTEYARERLRSYHDATFIRFIDIFHHRMLSLFYRAWANVRPTVSYDRPESDRFAFYLGAFSGISEKTFRQRDALDDKAKLFYIGHFSAQSKCAAGLQAIIGDLIKTKVQIEEFVGEWMQIQEQDYSRLGDSPELSTLGQSTLLGAYIWGCQHKFCIVLGPLELTQYLALLPSAATLAQLKDVVRNYIGDEMVWDVRLVLKSDQVPSELILGEPQNSSAHHIQVQAQLGWSTWLGSRQSSLDADDLTLNPFFSIHTESFL